MNARRQQGATLVEMAVAAAVGVIVVVAALQLHGAAAGAYATVTALERLEERGRAATTLLRREIARAGRAPCGGGAPVTDPGGGGVVTRSRHLLPHRGLVGTEHALTTATASADPAIAPWRVAAVEGEEQLTALQVTAMDNGAATIDAEAGQRILAGHCDSGLHRLRLTEDAAGNRLVVAHGPSPVPEWAGAPLWLEHEVTEGAATVAYEWRPESTGGGPALHRNGQPAVDGVEALAFRYGITDGDTVRFVPPADVTNWDAVVAVRAHLLVRSPEFAVLPPSPHTHRVADDTLGPFDDRRLRRTWTVTQSLGDGIL